MPRRKRDSHFQRPLLEPQVTWQHIPGDVRQHAIDVLTTFYLETVREHELESKKDDDTFDH